MCAHWPVPPEKGQCLGQNSGGCSAQAQGIAETAQGWLCPPDSAQLLKVGSVQLLAEHNLVVFVGTQLSSTDPWALGAAPKPLLHPESWVKILFI